MQRTATPVDVTLDNGVFSGAGSFDIVIHGG